MPDSLTPLLTEVNKADCIDFLESKMKAEVTNRLGQKSEMTELAPDYIRMQMTSRSFWQMKMLNVNDSTRCVHDFHRQRPCARQRCLLLYHGVAGTFRLLFPSDACIGRLSFCPRLSE